MSIRIVVMTQLMIASFDPLQSTARFILWIVINVDQTNIWNELNCS
jgi:hypothetical protein